MTNTTAGTAPDWAARFFEALRAGGGMREACRAAGVTSSTPYHRKARDDAFRAEWNAIKPADGRKQRRGGPPAPRGSVKIERFLEVLAVTSNVAAAAHAADLLTSKIYHLRRTSPEFARRWYAALAEGYDNLEMELLARLREGRFEDTDADGTKRKFDTAAALRCLTAHRESVAREKGRRTLAEEAATIAAINAKIDALRARAKESDAAIRQARKAISRKAVAGKARPGGEA